MFVGGAPRKPACRFTRSASSPTYPAFDERVPCAALRQPQGAAEAIWQDRNFKNAADILPVTERRRRKRARRRR